MMNAAPNRHDARALVVIDACLKDGHFTSEAVAAVSDAFAQAERADRSGHACDGELRFLCTARASRR